MNREEFLRELRLALQQRADYEKTEEQIKWYEDYILMQIRKGKDEAEVLDYLGDPRLLADSVAGSVRGHSKNGADFEDWSVGITQEWEDPNDKRLHMNAEPLMRAVTSLVDKVKRLLGSKDI